MAAERMSCPSPPYFSGIVVHNKPRSPASRQHSRDTWPSTSYEPSHMRKTKKTIGSSLFPQNKKRKKKKKKKNLTHLA
jgi:hypothetical protein